MRASSPRIELSFLLRAMPVLLVSSFALLVSSTAPGLFIAAAPSTSSSSSSYSPYQYDLTVPQFTPDGRLLQVEYALAAAERSGPVVWVRSEDGTGGIVLAGQRSHLNRLILVPGGTVVALSGVVADGLALLRESEAQGRAHRRRYGRDPTASEIAAFAADACQGRAFGGGIRPYGVCLLACGISSASNVVGVEAWQTDPSGALEEVLPPVRVVGGGEALRTTIRRRLEVERISDAPGGLGVALRSAARILIEECHKANQPLGTLEAVVLSPILGVHKLTPEQLRRLGLLTTSSEEAQSQSPPNVG